MTVKLPGFAADNYYAERHNLALLCTPGWIGFSRKGTPGSTYLSFPIRHPLRSERFATFATRARSVLSLNKISSSTLARKLKIIERYRTSTILSPKWFLYSHWNGKIEENLSFEDGKIPCPKAGQFDKRSSKQQMHLRFSMKSSVWFQRGEKRNEIVESVKTRCSIAFTGTFHTARSLARSNCYSNTVNVWEAFRGKRARLAVFLVYAPPAKRRLNTAYSFSRPTTINHNILSSYLFIRYTYVYVHDRKAPAFTVALIVSRSARTNLPLLFLEIGIILYSLFPIYTLRYELSRTGKKRKKKRKRRRRIDRDFIAIVSLIRLFDQVCVDQDSSILCKHARGF